MGEEELEVGEVGRGGEFGVGVGIFEEGDGVVEEFDGGGIVGDGEAALGDLGVGADDEVAGEDLGGFHRPKVAAVEGAEAAFTVVVFDGVGVAVGEDDGVLGRGLEEAAVVFVAEDEGVEVLLALPLGAPFLEDDEDDVLDEGDFDLGEVTLGLDGVAAAAEEAVGDGQSEAGVDVEDADADEGLGFEEAEVGGAGQRLGKLGVAHGGELGHLEAELHTEEEREAGAEVADEILVQEAENPAATTHLHSILCTIYLPHRRTEPDLAWQRSNGEGATLMIQPTKDEQGRYYGVPYGATGRLMMIYLQNEAYRNRSRQVELGRSMHAWLRAMGVDSSGKGYRAAREQALRIERSLVTVAYTGPNGKERWQDTIIRGSFNLSPPDESAGRQQELFPQLIQLSESFYEALIRHPAVLFEPAIKALAGKSLALDVYLWLAYRLHALERPSRVGWKSLHQAFGLIALRHIGRQCDSPHAQALQPKDQERVERGQKGQYKSGGTRLAVATGAPVIPIAVTSAKCWPRKALIKTPGTVAFSIGKPIPSVGREPDELMREVEAWIEAEMRRLDPEAYR